MRLEWESGQAILISDFFTLDHAVNLHLEKRSTVLLCASNSRTRPEQFQLARPLAKKFSKVVAHRDKNHWIREWFLVRPPGFEFPGRFETASRVVSVLLNAVLAG